VLTALVLVLAGCSGGPLALPEQIDLLYVGDSTGECSNPGIGPLFDDKEPSCDFSYAVQLARHLESEFGSYVEVSIFHINTIASTTRQLAELEPLRSAVGEAEILLLSNSGDAHSACRNVSSDDEIEAVAADHRLEVDGLLEAVTGLADPDETMIRIFGTPWIARVAFDDTGAFIDEQGVECTEKLGEAVEASAAEYGVTAVHFLTAFNGAPPYRDGSHLLKDDRHLNGDGALLAVQVFDQVGYAPFSTED
jgi:hypothetical protein